MDKTRRQQFIRVTGDVLLYAGLGLSALGIPTLAFFLWIKSLLDNTHPGYDYLWMAWLVSALMFVLGVIMIRMAGDQQE